MSEPDPAVARYFMIVAARISGALLVGLGVVAVSGAIEWLPVYAGYVLVAIGLIEFALLPRWLARRWRTPPDL